MNVSERNNNLLFLLGIASLAAVGCDGGETDTTSTSATTGTPTTSTGMTSTGMESTGMATTMAMTSDGSSTSEATTATTGSTTVGVTTDATDTAETEGLDCSEPPPKVKEIGQSCIDYGEFFNNCYYDGGLPQECVDLYDAYCQYYLDGAIAEAGEECGLAIEAQMVCISSLTCEEYEDKTPDCEKEDMAVSMACKAALLPDPMAKFRQKRSRR